MKNNPLDEYLQRKNEPGLAEGEFRVEEERIKREVEHRIAIQEGGRREKPEKMYFIFESKEKRDEALRLIKEERQHNDLFSFLSQWKRDSRRQDTGLEMDFSHHPRGQRQKLEEFFKQKGLYPIEEYEVDGD